METLYRKYRPSQWEDVIGQEHVVRTLTNELIRNTIVHTYLFTGPRGVGKTTSARLLAKAANCTNRGEGAEPCTTCEHCIAVQNGSAIDIIEIDAASHTGVDMVREHIIENARFMPTRGKYKIFIIDEVHMLSTSSFNALLKTLEEPPSHVIFILATTEIHKLLATIRSRCEEYTFRRVPHAVIIEKLQKILTQENRIVAPVILARIASMSEGCLRDAESLLGQVVSIKEGEITEADCERILPHTLHTESIAILQAVAHKDASAGLVIITKLYESAVDFYQFCTTLIELTRVGMLIKHKAVSDEARALLSEDTVTQLDAIAQALAPASFVRILEKLIEAREATPRAPLAHLPLEMAVVELCDSGTDLDTQQRSSAESLPMRKASLSEAAPAASASAPPEVSQPHPPKVGVVEKVTHLLHSDIKTSADDIRAQWNAFVDAVGIKNAALTFCLKMAEVTGIEGCKLVLTVPYSFHADKLKETKNKHAIEDVLKAVFGERMELDCRVTEMVQQEASVSSDVPVSGEIADLAEAFGGKVME